MGSLRESAALVALLRSERRPWQEYADLVEEAASAVAILEQEEGVLYPLRDLTVIEQEIDDWRSRGMQLITVLDPEYPDNLKRAHDRPALIFVAGRLGATDSRSIAVIGTRAPSRQGIDTAQSITRYLVAKDFTVTSGLAAGIDTAAHTTALEADGRTVAVIGTGLTRTYPPQNAALQERIATEGAVVSQFWPDQRPSKRNFPIRNATTSGLSLATVVVEASHTSGARVQARLALGHGRPVFLTRRLLEDQAWARAFAARPGVYVIGDPEEITETVERLNSSSALTA